MIVERNAIRTGLLVVLSLGAFVAVLIYVGSPGAFVPQKTFRIYFDNAATLKPGAEVLLAGRKVGRVKRIHSPVPANERPNPKMEAMVEVEVQEAASIYQRVKVVVSQPNLLGEPVIDFINGEESSGWALEGQSFLGERPGGLAEVVPTIMEKIEPTMEKATATLESLQKTAENLTKMTAKDADLTIAFGELRKFSANLKELSSETGPLHKSLANVEAITGPDGKIAKTIDNIHALTGPDSPLAKALANSEKFTATLTQNKDIENGLRSFRQASEKLNATMGRVGPQVETIGKNLADASETIKHQPWRLIWRGSKDYPEEKAEVSVKPPLRPKSTAPAKPPTGRQPLFKRKN